MSGSPATTVILFNVHTAQRLAEINAWLHGHGYQRGLVDAFDPSLMRDWYVTTGKGFEADVAVGAFTAFPTADFLRFLRRIPWGEQDSYWCQACVLEPGDDRFRLHRIWQLGYDRASLAGFGPVEALDDELGPVVDPVIALLDRAALTVPGAIAEVRAWLRIHAPGVELRPNDALDLAAWGLWDDFGRMPRQSYTVVGTFDHAWAYRLWSFLQTLDWAPPGDDRPLGYGSVYLLVGSPGGWRLHAHVPANRAPVPPRSATLRPWDLDAMRDLVTYACVGEARARPALDDLARLDALCLDYARLRGLMPVGGAP